jgi:hypothetical protein
MIRDDAIVWEMGASAEPAGFSIAAVLLHDVRIFIRRYVVLSDDQAVALALWTAHTHTIDAADTTPYQNISSATKRAGKTRLLEVLEPIVR